MRSGLDSVGVMRGGDGVGTDYGVTMEPLSYARICLKAGTDSRYGVWV